jgi:hypothetical protein
LVNNEQRCQHVIATSCLIIMLVMGCESSDAMQDETDQTMRAGTQAVSGASGASAGASGGTSGNNGVTFTSLYETELKTCRLDICHGGGRAGLNMATKESALATLVNQPADPPSPCGKSGKLRVKPGDPEESLLYLKLVVDTPCGDPMPVGGQLPDASRERVRQWIEAGALDN